MSWKFSQTINKNNDTSEIQLPRKLILQSIITLRLHQY